LAETSGLPESFRILTLFDKKFQSLWKPQNLRFEEYETILASQVSVTVYKTFFFAADALAIIKKKVLGKLICLV
jgi:hypothetical protein